MAIPLTNLHKGRVADQVAQNLVGLQTDMRRNATLHKSAAQAQSVPLDTLQTWVQTCALEYLRRFKWITDLRADPVRKQRLLDAIAAKGWVETDIVDVLTPMRQAAITLRDASKASYADIITACDAVLSAVEAPDSLWPE
jgi:hypothetical protein